jgi:hypothetical protein
MPALVTGVNNLHTVYVHGQPLGVECTGCGHRALAYEGEVEDLKGNMRELRRLGFVCSKCGSRAWRGWLFLNAEETAAFREGRLTVSPMDGGRPTF